MGSHRITAAVLAATCAAALANEAATQPTSSIEPPEYRPVPALTAGVASPVISLCGTWQFRVNPDETFHTDPAGGAAGAADIDVPGEWVMQGFTVPADGAAGYRRSFTLPADWKGCRIILRADAIYSDCRLWINDKEAGSHLGGFTPFELDITSLVRPGKNRIAFCVKSESLADTLASGSKYAVHPLGGITRKIRLFALPAVHVTEMSVSTDLDAAYKDAVVRLTAVVRNKSPEPANVTLTTEILGPWLLGRSLRDDANKPLVTRRTMLEVHPAIESGASLAIDLPSPALWHTEHPNLYVARLTISIGGKVVETVERKFGCRKVEVRGSQMLVNGKVQKVLGVCRHEVHPLRGRSLTGDLWRKDVELYRAANVNILRTSHYPSAEELFDAADELGMFIECEAPFCWASPPKGQAEAATAATIGQTLEMGQFYRSHPCVLFWSLGNESPWNEHFVASSLALRKLDPTRPQTAEHFRGNPAEWAKYTEIFSTHYPGPGGPEKYRGSDRPVNFGEYCHLNAYNRFELATDPGLRDAWGGAFAPMVDAMRASPGVLGGSIWAAMDDTFFIPPPRENPAEGGKVVGYGTWGPLDGWRRPKPEYWHMKKAYSPVRVLTRDAVLPAAGGEVTVHVANRYVFTNLRDLRIDWLIGAGSGTAQADVAPGSDGSFTINVPPAGAGQELLVRFTSPLGFVVDESVVGAMPSATITAQSKTDAPAAGLAADEACITLPTWSGVAVAISRRTGLLVRGKAVTGSGSTAIGGPHLVILPLNGTGDTQMKGKAPEYPIFSSPCRNWEPNAPAAVDANAFAVTGKYDEAAGTFTYRPTADGALEISYSFICSRDVNPRQVGIVLDLPKAFDTLSWRRKGLWSYYPDDHIGRLSGTAKAFPAGADICTQVGPARQPSWPWKDDITVNGSNDFRSTKASILWASLRTGEDKGNGFGAIELLSDGTQCVRAWVDGDAVHLLIAGYSNAGAEGFFRSHAQAGYAPLKKGDKVAGKVVVRLTP